MKQPFPRRTLILVLLLCSLALTAAFAQEAKPILPPGRQVSTKLYAPTLNATTDGYLTVATPTLTVGTSAAVALGTLPTGTKVVEIWAFNGDVNVGPSGVGTGLAVPFIASGSFIERAVSTLTPAIYLRGRTGTASVSLNAR